MNTYESTGASLIATWLILVSLLLPSPRIADRSEPQDQGTSQMIKTAEKEGVRLSLLIEESIYGPGQTVRVTATAENLNPTPAIFWMANMDDPPVHVWVDTPFFGPQTLRNPADPQVVRDAIGSAVLGPGQKLVREVSWDQMMPAGLKGPVQAPPGQYSVNAALNLGRYQSSGNNKSLRVEVAITIERSKPIISIKQAMESALSIPRVLSWIKVHGRMFVLRSYATATYFKVSQGKLQELAGNPNSGGASGTGSGGVANCAIHLEPGPVWRLNMIADNDDHSYSEMHVVMDATNGSVLHIESRTNR